MKETLNVIISNLVDDKDALTISFGLELSFSNVNVELSYDKNEKLYRFYSG